MLSKREWEQLGAMIAEAMEDRMASERNGPILAMAATVATTTALGYSPFRDFVSSNGDTIAKGEAAVWIGQFAQNPSTVQWCPVRRGVSLAEGDIVRVVRDHWGSTLWWVDAKL